MRYIRAFFKALAMTLRGETYVRSYEPLWVWIEQGIVYADAALQAVYDNALDGQIRLKLEGRAMTLKTIMGGVAHHLKQEYPYLLQHMTEHTITGIYATNMNDIFYIARLLDLDAVRGQAGQDVLTRLSAHLNSIPPSESLRAR